MTRFRQMIRVENRDKSKCSKFLLRFFASCICVLGVLLVLLITLAINGLSREDKKHSTSVHEDGKYATTFTSCGTVQGIYKNGSYAFLGLQYAIPPTGKLRWLHSKTHYNLSHCWNGTYEALERRKPCWQFYQNGSYDGAEDCLYLDVYTPQLNSNPSLPVVVFIAGETLNGGESDDLQPSAELAKIRNCIFVSISIRRSALGFMSINILSQSSPTRSSGNYGLSDVITALQWVQINIGKFGGDPKRVTLLGHQSGATLLSVMLQYRIRTDLYKQLWISGGPPATVLTLDVADELNREYLEQAGCRSSKCLYDTPPEEVLESVPNEWRTFHHDLTSITGTDNQNDHEWIVFDETIVKSANKHEARSEQSPVRIVMGSSMHIDASSELRSLQDWNDTGQFREYLDKRLGPYLASEALRLYFRPGTNHWQQTVSMISDYKTICPLLKLASGFFSSDAAYFYVVTNVNRTPLGNLVPQHSDITAILSTLSPRGYKEKRFTDNIVKMFYSFVETGYLSSTPSRTPQKILLIDTKVTFTDSYVRCDFWNRLRLLKMSQNKSQDFDELSEIQ